MDPISHGSQMFLWTDELINEECVIIDRGVNFIIILSCII